eukprot:gene14230-29174_t
MADAAKRAAMIAKAAARSAPPPSVTIGQLRNDKKEAIKIARLKIKAAGRGAAPVPGQAPPPAAAAGLVDKAKGRGAILKVTKYRALEAYSGEVSYEPGATLFAMGEEKDGMIMAVVNGASGMVKMSTLTPITPELLAAEREAREEAAQEAREAKEASLSATTEEREAAMQEELKKLDEKYANSTPGDTSAGDALAEEASKQAAAAANKEIEEAKAEEEKLKAEAARLEELMRQLDMSDEDDSDGE